MLSRSQSRLAPSKSSKPSAKKVPSRLYQPLLRDFVKCKSKTTRAQKENKGLITIAKTTKRRREEAENREERDLPKKKRKKDGDVVTGQKHGQFDTPSRWSEGVGDHPSLPIVLDSQAEISWDDTTVWDSATTSRTLQVEQDALIPCSPKSPANPKKRNVQQQPYGSVFVDATPKHGNGVNFNDDPFVASSSRTSPPMPSRKMEVIPSSQSQEMEHLRFTSHFTANTSHLHAPRQLGITSDESVPSSQSQHLLPYGSSPLRPLRLNKGGSLPEMIPSSQLLAELEFKVPSTSLREYLSTSVGYGRDTSADSLPIFHKPSLDSGVRQAHSPTMATRKNQTSTPQKQRKSTSPLTETPALISHGRPPPQQNHSVIISTSPPPMSSSQYSYLDGDASYPPEMQNFISMFGDGHHSLGSDFHDTSLGQLSATKAQDPWSRAKNPVSQGLPSPKYRRSPPEPPTSASDPCLTSDSIPTQYLRTNDESEYTFVEESCPPVLTDFLDMVCQDRSDLDSQFQKLT